MNEERIWYLLSLRLSGEATDEELKELSTLLQQHPELGLRADIMRNIWHSKQSRFVAPVTANNFDKHLQRLSNHLAEPALQFGNDDTDNIPAIPTHHRRNRFRWLWAAAGVAASVLVFFILFLPAKKNTPVSASNTVSTRPGSKSKVELPDGTQVWLNADSKLTYDQNFMGNTREVRLSGEAYFDVTHVEAPGTGERIPFIIHTNSIDIKVLGTAFNVRSYPGEKTTETALIRGSVEVTLHSSPDNKIILKPDEKLIVKNDDGTVIEDNENKKNDTPDEAVMTLSKLRPIKNDTSNHYETMWVKNNLAFENESFDRILAEIERWYNVSVIVKNESLKSLHFSGVFDNESLVHVMEALSWSKGFHYEIKGSQVIIW